MKIDYSKRFLKQLNKCDEKIQISFEDRLELFIDDKFHPKLNNHSLKGKLFKYRSINITGNWRALYLEFENGEVIFFDLLGTHSELYK